MSRVAGLLLAVGLLVASVSAGRVWVEFTVRDPVLGVEAREATGYTLAPALSACGLMALAAVLVLLLTRRRARASGLVVLALSALWAMWLLGRAMQDPVGSAAAALSEPGLNEASLQVVRGTATAWPWLCAVGILLVLSAVVWLGWSWLRHGRTRGEAGPTPAPPPPRAGDAPPLPDAERARRSNHDAWRDLSEGKDPTD